MKDVLRRQLALCYWSTLQGAQPFSNKFINQSFRCDTVRSDFGVISSLAIRSPYAQAIFCNRVTRKDVELRRYPVPANRIGIRVSIRVTRTSGGFNGEGRIGRSVEAGRVIGTVMIVSCHQLAFDELDGAFASRCALSLTNLVKFYDDSRGVLFAWHLRDPMACQHPPLSRETQLHPSETPGVVWTTHSINCSPGLQ